MILIDEFAQLPLWIIRNMPGRLGVFLRRLYWSTRLGRLGKKVVLGRNVAIQNPRYVSIGNNCWIDDNVTLIAGPPGKRPHINRIGSFIFDSGYLKIGDGTHVAINVVIQAHGGVLIEGETTIASGSKIYSLSHHYKNLDDSSDQTRYIFGSMVEEARQYLLIGSVKMERGTAVGLNSVVLPGTVLREYSWLGSSSVLSGETLRGVILSGNPAKVVKIRHGFMMIGGESI